MDKIWSNFFVMVCTVNTAVAVVFVIEGWESRAWVYVGTAVYSLCMATWLRKESGRR